MVAVAPAVHVGFVLVGIALVLFVAGALVPVVVGSAAPTVV